MSGISAGSGKNAIGNDIYREAASNRVIVGGFTTNIRSVCRGEGLRGGRMQEGGVVVPRGDKEKTLGNLVRGITGS